MTVIVIIPVKYVILTFTVSPKVSFLQPFAVVTDMYRANMYLPLDTS